MSPRLKKFLVACGYALLFVACIAAWFLLAYLVFVVDSSLFGGALTSLDSQVAELVFNILGVVLLVVFSGIYMLCSIFTEKIISSYQSFKDENGGDDIFSKVYNDPTIGVKDKILFLSIYLIYCIQLPFLYCTSKISTINSLLQGWKDGGFSMPLQGCLILINAVLLIPVALLELIKYPLVRLFSPLGLNVGLNVKQLSFLFNISDVGTGSQSVHASSFEHSILQCAQELKQKFGAQPNVLNKELEDYINNSDGLTTEKKEQLKLYLNFNGSNRATWQESKTGLTLTQTANLVLTAAKDQKSDIDFLKCMLLIRFKEGNGKCNLGMFNRIIYSLNCLEAKNNFTVEVNSQVYERMPSITEKFLRSCNNKKITVLKDNFDNFYSDGDMDPQIKSNISKLIEEAKQSVFNELYVDYYNRYGQEVGRGPIKQKLRELITDDDIKEAVSAVIDDIAIPPVPPTYLERVKAFLGGHARSSAA